MLRISYIACLVSLCSKFSTRQVLNVVMLFDLSSGSKGLIHLTVPGVRNYTSNRIFQCITAFVFHRSLALAFVHCRINPLFGGSR
jgi:hypothetical protein